MPDYIIPSAIVPMATLPLTDRGKVDRAALPRPGRSERSRAPDGAIETVLCEACAELLAIESVGADDDFFDLGGDSIGAIQLASRVRRADVIITARDVFQQRTMARLAAAARRPAAMDAAADVAVGDVPATPIMRWWQARGGPIRRVYQAMLLQTPAEADEASILATVQAVVDHHDVLRMRLSRRSDGVWSYEIGAVGSVVAARVYRRATIARLAGRHGGPVARGEGRGGRTSRPGRRRDAAGRVVR